MTASIGVVVPAFNAVSTVERALESVLVQTVPPAEVVVVDDGSSDGTQAVVMDFIGKHGLRNWRCQRQPNAGPAAARDTGIRSMTSIQVALLDADDAWGPEHLRRSLNALDEQGFDVVGSRLQRRRDASDDLQAAPVVVNPSAMLFRNPYFTSTVAFRRQAYLDAGGFDTKQRYAEDYKLWLAMAFGGFTLGLLPYTDASYRSGGTVAPGLSQRLWEMERNELRNYRSLYRAEKIGFTGLLAASSFSLFKFSLRLLGKR